MARVQPAHPLFASAPVTGRLMDGRGVPAHVYAQIPDSQAQAPQHTAAPGPPDPYGRIWPTPLDTALDGVHSQHPTYTPAYGDQPPDSAASTLTISSSFGLQTPREPSPSSSHDSNEPFQATDRPLTAGSSSHVPEEPPRKRKKTRERVALAPDQPLTTQGKERQRVYLACAQCRQRKIRCDGGKPTCEVCVKRGVTGCNYDSAPKRRGPDRHPGARQRLRSDEQDETTAGGVRRRRRRRTDGHSSPSDGPQLSQYEAFSYGVGQLPSEAPIIPPHMDGYRIPPVDMPEPSSSLSPSTLSAFDAYQYGASQVPAYGQLTPMGYHTATSTAVRSAYITSEDEQPVSPPIGYNLATEPTMDFIRDTWWDNLLGMYCAPGGAAHGQVAPGLVPTRDIAVQAVTTDLRFLFRHSNYWLAFFHVRSFLDTLFNPEKRARMQPAVVLAALALSTLLQSSEHGRGAAGREAALRLRDAAQGALDASVSTRWVDDHLAQAALLLALFEVCGHPRHSTQRARDSMVVLDNIIRTLSLTAVDHEDPYVTTYASPAALPSTHRHTLSPGRMELRKYFYGATRTPPSALQGSEPPLPDPRALHHQLYAHQEAVTQQTGPSHVTHTGCSCLSLTLGARSPLAREQTPMWLATAGWSNDWDEGLVRKEACRRVCWSALALAAGHTSYASAITGSGLDLTITNPTNFALFFNGEAMSRSVETHGARTAKDTIWALYNRVMLLWHACLRLRVDDQLAYADKAQLAMAAWLELDSIEAALDAHTCNLERAFMFQGREVIFNTRMVISYEYQKFIPDVMTNFNGFFHRAKAEDWLHRQLKLAAGMMQNYGDLTGLKSNMLTYRPFFSLWLMAQVSKCLMLWRVDSSLTMALEVAEMWLPPIDYLLAVWPSAPTRERYETLRQQLAEACIVAGRRLPPPVAVALAPPERAL